MSERKSDFAPIDRWLFTAMMLGPLAWILHLTISYLLVPESCDDNSKWILHLTTMICLPLTVVAAGMAWRMRAASMDERTRWMAGVVAGLSLLMTLLVIAQEIPNLILRSCD